MYVSLTESRWEHKLKWESNCQCCDFFGSDMGMTPQKVIYQMGFKLTERVIKACDICHFSMYNMCVRLSTYNLLQNIMPFSYTLSYGFCTPCERWKKIIHLKFSFPSQQIYFIFLTAWCHWVYCKSLCLGCCLTSPWCNMKGIVLYCMRVCIHTHIQHDSKLTYPAVFGNVQLMNIFEWVYIFHCQNM